MGLSPNPPWACLWIRHKRLHPVPPWQLQQLGCPVGNPPYHPWWVTLACWFRTMSLVYLFGISLTSRIVRSSPERYKPWFLNWGKLAAIFFTPSSWGSQRAGHSTSHQRLVVVAVECLCGQDWYEPKWDWTGHILIFIPLRKGAWGIDPRSGGGDCLLCRRWLTGV
jgi:hypothetical protein